MKISPQITQINTDYKKYKKISVICDTVWQLLVFFARIFGPGTGNKIITILLRQKILSYFLGLFLTFHPSTLLPFFGCGRRPRCVICGQKFL